MSPLADNMIASGDQLETLLKQNLTWPALPEYLRYKDRNSMAFSKESKLPFLDHRLVEFVSSLPSEYKAHGGTTKWIQREGMRNEVPKHITDNRIKRGFISPQEVWQLSGDLKSRIDTRFYRPKIFFLSVWRSFSKKRINDGCFRWRVALFNELSELS